MDAFLAAGPVEITAFGEQPLSWQNLHFWRRETESDLEPGELEAVVDMSYTYLVAADEYREKLIPAPYMQTGYAERQKVDTQLRRALDALVTSPKKPPPGTARKTVRKGG